MLFYNAECTMQNPIDAEEKGDEWTIQRFRNTREHKEDIRVKGEIFNEQAKQPFACFYRIDDNKCSLVAAVKFDEFRHNTAKGVFELLLSAADIAAKIDEISEITARMFAKYIELADNASFIRSRHEALENLNINDFSRYGDFRTQMNDKIIEVKTKAQNFARAKQIVCGKSLCAELERISDSKKEAFLGHPAHYIINSNDSEIAGAMQDVLLCALLGRKRIVSARVSEINSSMSIDGIKKLFAISKGGSVVINMDGDDDEESDYMSKADNLIQICKVIKEHRHGVLSVLRCPLSDGKIKERIAEQIPDVVFVELCEDLVFADGAKKYLRALARAKGVKKYASLLQVINGHNAAFRAAELNKIFGTWYDGYLRTEVFQGYKELKPPIIKNDAPKGDAFGNLQSMIGLSSVKNIIKEAINYHKVQNFIHANPLEISRHMVFTGNPGTAKTTVARLFSQIMKDNGLLSDGTIIEVGRAQLVGKYVGHTAPKVKDAFKQAKGGVLFIDEAYSLVDDKRGLYGDEAINTIVQEMGNHQDDTVVIFAGYPREMENFLQTNPGLRSRIAYHIGFDDYDVNELFEILKLMMSKKNLTLDEGAQEKVLKILQQAATSENFGNGRYVRNLLERAAIKQATRLVETGLENVSEREKTLLTGEDFELLALGKIRANVGF